MSARSGAIDFDRRTFRNAFDRRPFTVQHDLAGHPLFELDRLIALSRTLPPAQVEFAPGNLTSEEAAQLEQRTDLNVAETIRCIAECDGWLVLKDVETHPEYRALSERCLAPIRELCPDMRGVELFVFISSPGAFTPPHIDPECNFLLQIHGTKTVHTLPPRDGSFVTETVLERFHADGPRNLTGLTREAQSKATVFELASGNGLHIPITAPHWVRNGPHVSVSFSVTFRTDASDRREITYRVNRWLRTLRLRPRPVGQSPAVDGVKYALFDAARTVGRLARTSLKRGPHVGS